MKNKSILFLFCIFFLINCKSLEKENTKTENVITAIKFMYTVNTYGVAISTNTFWYATDEHAKLNLSLKDKPNLIELAEEMPLTTFEEFELLKYAFILENKNKSKNDTIYADHQLNTWIIIKNKKHIYHQDENGEFSDFMKRKYSFFNECW